ncbi:MAG: hypothetical protein H6807_16825 [Planctomycetes bacterium]|nr:hypothetical protein [Planctomycetota bacterium]
MFKRRPAVIKLALHDGSDGPEPHLGGRFNLKELQRRAFERGQAVEREHGSRAFAALCARLEAQARTQTEARENDRRRLEEFATRLALMVAEKLTYSRIATGEHDVAAMVRELLGELGPAAEGAPVKLRLFPGDHALVLEAAARGELALDGIAVTADPTIGAGCAVLATDEVEYWSMLNDRIERLRQELIAESNHD